MDKIMEKPKKNLEESIRQRLKNLSKKRSRPFDETLRYYAMERFLYRLSVSPYAKKFFLKGGLILKVLDSMDHRATMDIDLLAHTSNQMEHLRHIILEILAVDYAEDAIAFNTKKLILKNSQTTGDYQGVRVSFSAKLFTTTIPILIDIGFSDTIIPRAQKIQYPTLLQMPKPILFGYTLETVIAEKLESIVKLGLVNTRMKDFYDLWMILTQYETDMVNLQRAIKTVFANRKTPIKVPVAFTSAFYENNETKQRWVNFLSAMGKDLVELREIVQSLKKNLSFLLTD